MEQFGTGAIILVLVGIWYLGSSINKVLEGSGELAEAEFTQFKRQQDIRIHKSRIKEHKQVDKFKDQPVYTDAEWQKIFAKDKDED